MRATRRGTPDSAARLRALTRRAYTATAGHLDLDDDAGREFDRIVSGETIGSPREDPTGSGRGSSGARGHDRRLATRPRRWAVSARAAVVVLTVLAALAGAVVARAIATGPSNAVPVPQLVVESFGPAEDGAEGGVGSGTGGGGSGVSGGEGANWTAGEAAGEAGTVADDGAMGAAGTAAASAGPGAGDPQGPRRAGTGDAPSVVVVHVAGAVAVPGVVELLTGARVADAIDSAGGAQPDAELAAVNLARPVQDGEQVYVPRVGEAPPGASAGAPGPVGAAGAPGPGSGGSGGGADAAEVVDLNSADLTALDTLPGVGPAIAQRILEWREANGPFHSVEELLEVSGIGPATLDRLRDKARV